MALHLLQTGGALSTTATRQMANALYETGLNAGAHTTVGSPRSTSRHRDPRNVVYFGYGVKQHGVEPIKDSIRNYQKVWTMIKMEQLVRGMCDPDINPAVRDRKHVNAQG